MIKTQRILGIVFALIAVGSLVLPYVTRSNFRFGNPLLPGYADSVTLIGWELASPKIAVVLAMGCAALLFSKYRASMVVAFLIAVANCFFLYVVHEETRFQGFITHDFDTKIETGIYALVCSLVGLAFLAGIAMIAAFRRPKVKETVPDLLDDGMN